MLLKPLKGYQQDQIAKVDFLLSGRVWEQIARTLPATLGRVTPLLSGRSLRSRPLLRPVIISIVIVSSVFNILNTF